MSGDDHFIKPDNDPPNVMTDPISNAEIAELDRLCAEGRFHELNVHGRLQKFERDVPRLIERVRELEMTPILKIALTDRVLDAGVSYLFASGLVHWNEPRRGVVLNVRELLEELAMASDEDLEENQAKSCETS